MEIINKIISYLISPQSQRIFLPLKIFFLVLSLIFLLAILLAFWRSTWLKRRILFDLVEFFTYRPYGVKKITKQWQKTMARLETGREGESKLAIIEADSLLDEILKRMGYAGETLGERLGKLTVAVLPNLDQVWEAHKIRNNIVHDPDYRLSLDEAKKVLGIYEKALSDLQAF